MRALLFLLCLTLRAQDDSARKEMVLGRAIADDLRRSTTPVESQAVQQYVAQLGARIAQQLPARSIPYTFEVVQTMSSPLRAPRTLPGGHIFVPLDLFLTAVDESEFAGMLAQAVARAPRLAVVQGIFVADENGDIPFPSSMIPKLRAIELEADALAAPALQRAGFDPAGLLRYIERCQIPRSDSTKRFPSLPPADRRIAALQEVVRTLPVTASVSSDAFLSIRRQLGETVRDVRPTLRRR